MNRTIDTLRAELDRYIEQKLSCTDAEFVMSSPDILEKAREVEKLLCPCN